MNGWKMHAFQFNRARKEIGEKRVSEDILPMYTEGEIDVSFTNYPDINPQEYTFYYKVIKHHTYFCIKFKHQDLNFLGFLVNHMAYPACIIIYFRLLNPIYGTRSGRMEVLFGTICCTQHLTFKVSSMNTNDRLDTP